MTHVTIERSAAIAVLVEQRYLVQRQPHGLVAELRRRGCAVRLADPASEAVSLTDASWLAGVDVCVARGRSEAVLSRLLAAERHGVPTVNRPGAVAAVVDKAGMAAALAGAGIPTPPTVLGTPAQLAAGLAPDLYPVILKPIRGDNCCGLRVCGTPEDVARLSAGVAEPLLAQPYLPSDGTDLKLYGVGERVWAVRKPSPLHSSESASDGSLPEAVEVNLTLRLRDLAHDCAALFGVELFGIDCLLTAAGPIVIEVNDFPNYTGIADADSALASHVLACVPEASPLDAMSLEVAR